MRPILKVLLCLQLVSPLFAFPIVSIDVDVTTEADDLEEVEDGDGDGDDTERERSKRSEPPPDYALVEIPPVLRSYLPMCNKTHCNISQEDYLYMHKKKEADDLEKVVDGDNTERDRSKRSQPPPDYALVEIPPLLRPYLPMYNETHCDMSLVDYPFMQVRTEDDLEEVEDGGGDDTERERSKRSEPPPDYALVEIPEVLRSYLPMYNETHCNMSKEDYLYMHRGPKHLPIVIVIPLTIIYSMIFITGILGNTMVAIVVVKYSTMHSATNFYLFSLAISDLMLLLLGLPNDLSVYWQQYPWMFGETVCRLRALCSEMSSYCSVMTIVAFSVERYLAVCRPLESYQISTFSRASKIIAGIWFSSFIFSLPFAILTDVNYLDFPPDSGRIIEESAFCAMLIKDVPNVPVYEVSTVLFFGIPLISLIYMYWEILKKLRERELHAMNGRGLGVGQAQIARQQHSRRSIIKMLGAVVICFFLCWAPFHLQRLFYMHMSHSPHYQIINEWLYYVTGCFYFFSSTVNPILYTLMSNKYREAFRDILFCCRNRRERRATLRGKRLSEGTTSNRGAYTEEPHCSTEPSFMEKSSRRRQSEQDTCVHASDQNGNTTIRLITQNGENSNIKTNQQTEESNDIEAPQVKLNEVKNLSKETYI